MVSSARTTDDGEAQPDQGSRTQHSYNSSSAPLKEVSPLMCRVRIKAGFHRTKLWSVVTSQMESGEDHCISLRLTGKGALQDVKSQGLIRKDALSGGAHGREEECYLAGAAEGHGMLEAFPVHKAGQ